MTKMGLLAMKVWFFLYILEYEQLRSMFLCVDALKSSSILA